jgi:arylsulfatase A-like enzyme
MAAGLAINGNWRGGKHDVWEGGFREPFLVRWPGHVPAGSVSRQMICITDVLATLAGVLHVPLKPGQAEDSIDVLRAFTETEQGPPLRDYVVLQAADSDYALRMGDWKFIERLDRPKFEYRNKKQAQVGENRHKQFKTNDLYNLADDPSEAKNVVGEGADRAAAMKRQLVTARDQGYTRPGAGK